MVDDDPEVHQALSLALSQARIHGRRIRLAHCTSAAEARRLLQSGADTFDLVLLDVVMETADAGLRLLDEINGLSATRTLPVILHTGQPGSAPEHVVRGRYEISGYLTKATVTRQGLIEALGAVLAGGPPTESSL